MENENILLVTLGLTILFGLVSYYLIFTSERKDKKMIGGQWQDFLLAVANNNIDEINIYGDKLVWNKHLNQEQLSKITEVVTSKADEFPELEKLKLDAFNKQIYYNRSYPESGSSGEKQSW